MNKVVIFFLSCLIILGMITCKPKKGEPEAEQTLFENLKSCCQTNNCSVSDSATIALEKLMKTDSVVLKNVKSSLNLAYIGVNDSFRNLIDPVRFPEWGKGHLLYACNIPKELKESTYYYDIEFDCVFYQFRPITPGARIETWPIRLTRVKILNKTTK